MTCFACGAHAESDAALDAFDCPGPSCDHPPYLLSDGTFETCAAHPYADREPLARAILPAVEVIR